MKPFIKFSAWVIMLSLLMFFFSSCLISSLLGKSYHTELKEFYEAVNKSKIIMEDCINDIYTQWTAALFVGNTEELLLAAMQEHEKDYQNAINLKPKIEKLYDRIKNGDDEKQIKDVFTAYIAYYSLFTFQDDYDYFTFSLKKDQLNSNLQNALQTLYRRL